MNFTIFVDGWSQGFMMETLTPIISDSGRSNVSVFKPYEGETIPLVNELVINGFQLNSDEVGKYDLAVHDRDDAGIFSKIIPGDITQDARVRVRSYLQMVADKLVRHLNNNNASCLVVFQPIKADRLLAVWVARAMGIPVISINPEPFPGYYWLDNGAPQHTGFLSSIDNWHRIQKIIFSQEEEEKYQEWQHDFFIQRRTRGSNWLDETQKLPPSQLQTEKPNQRILVIGQMLTDANQFMYSRGIQYRPDLVVQEINKFSPDTEIFYKPHPMERDRDKDKIDFSGCSNFVILPAKTNMHDYLGDASVHRVITWNSNSGIEALAFGKPLAVMGEAFYRGKDFTYDLGTIEELESGSLSGFLNWVPDKQMIHQYLKFMICRYLVPAGDDNAFNNRIDNIIYDNSFFGM